jgi:L-iditol 2-dehydrogenase
MRAMTKLSHETKDVRVLDDTPRPIPGPGFVLIKVEACGLCGSDLHAWKGDPGYEWVNTPVIMGHESVGHVVEIGPGVDQNLMSKRVVPISIDGDGTCNLCDQGLRQICSHRTVLGLSFDGAAADFVVIAANRLVDAPEGVAAATLALAEPLSVAQRAVNHLVTLESKKMKVVVSGPGPIGLMAALILAKQGHEVQLLGAPRDEDTRLPLARELGLRTATSADELDPDIEGWIEASGAFQALITSIDKVLAGSQIITVGLFARLGELDFNIAVRKEIRISGSYASIRADYEGALTHLAEDPELWGKLVTTLPLEDGVLGLELAESAKAVKVVLLP